MITERDQLQNRFQELKAQGLVDMKLHLGRRASEATVEAVCAEVNRIDDLMDRGVYRCVNYATR